MRDWSAGQPGREDALGSTLVQESWAVIVMHRFRLASSWRVTPVLPLYALWYATPIGIYAGFPSPKKRGLNDGLRDVDTETHCCHPLPLSQHQSTRIFWPLAWDPASVICIEREDCCSAPAL